MTNNRVSIWKGMSNGIMYNWQTLGGKNLGTEVHIHRACKLLGRQVQDTRFVELKLSIYSEPNFQHYAFLLLSLEWKGCFGIYSDMPTEMPR